MNMSEGEKFVWAATYSQCLRDNHEKSRHLVAGIPLEDGLKIERGFAVDAIESADIAVRLLRRAGNKIKDGWGEDSTTFKSYCEMTNYTGHVKDKKG